MCGDSQVTPGPPPLVHHLLNVLAFTLRILATSAVVSETDSSGAVSRMVFDMWVSFLQSEFVDAHVF